MCGRYGLTHLQPVLADWYKARMPEFSPLYNIAPTARMLTVLEIGESRTGSLMRWGLIPFWAKGSQEDPDHERCPRRNGGRQADVQVGLPRAALPHSRVGIFRVEGPGQEQTAVFYLR